MRSRWLLFSLTFPFFQGVICLRCGIENVSLSHCGNCKEYFCSTCATMPSHRNVCENGGVHSFNPLSSPFKDSISISQSLSLSPRGKIINAPEPIDSVILPRSADLSKSSQEWREISFPVSMRPVPYGMNANVMDIYISCSRCGQKKRGSRECVNCQMLFCSICQALPEHKNVCEKGSGHQFERDDHTIVSSIELDTEALPSALPRSPAVRRVKSPVPHSPTAFSSIPCSRCVFGKDENLQCRQCFLVFCKECRDLSTHKNPCDEGGEHFYV